MGAHDVVITGLGLVSCLGEGVDAHWRALTAADATPAIDTERYPPYTIHPLPAIDWSLQIPKRGDQRQMETWQRLGTYAAGLALDDAAMKDEAMCASMDMVIAAGGGERDEAVDAMILAASEARPDLGVLLNEKLTTELRPTLFLAQLSNLLAGNISIVHKVTGSSRTFMGEEGSGISAVQTAAARIASGQSDHVLVGGAFETEHPDMLLGYELGGYLHRDTWKPVWQRQGSVGGGLVSASGAGFLVLESRAHAEARGRKPYAVLDKVVAGRSSRKGDLAAEIGKLLESCLPGEHPALCLSAASGAHAATAAEKSALDARGSIAARGFATRTGHLKEAAFPFAVALAAIVVSRRTPYPAFDAASEAAYGGPVDAVLATSVGYHRAEGVALVTADA
ncbi:MAG: beta-ketoacyl-ACP synthase [Rhizobiaceae bacterium]|nr:beta-ketoacyl-ACP synthase [Rhizobiaceae bacterium]